MLLFGRLATVTNQSRFDFSRLSQSSKIERLPHGGARVPAHVTSVGVFPYTQPDGSVRHELRPASEVFHKDSLESLQDLPVVEGHPAMIDPSNYSKFAKGNVSGIPKQDGRFVDARLAIGAGDTLAGIDKGEIVEVSCGYTCDIDSTPGVFDGQPYDVIQRNIRYNHVGLGPKNWGRQGNEVALHLDGGAYTNMPDKEGENRMPTIKLDGKDYEKGSDEHLLALSNKLDAADVNTKELQKRLDTADAELVAAQAKVKALETKVSTFDADVAARATLLATAGGVLGETVKLDGKTNEEIRAEVVKVAFPEAKIDGRSADYVQALYDRAVETGVRADGIGKFNDALREVVAGTSKETKEDSAPQKRPEIWAMTKEGA